MEEAEPLLLAAYQVLSEARPSGHPYPTMARRALQELYEQRGDSERAAAYAGEPDGLHR